MKKKKISITAKISLLFALEFVCTVALTVFMIANVSQRATPIKILLVLCSCTSVAIIVYLLFILGIPTILIKKYIDNKNPPKFTETTFGTNSELIEMFTALATNLTLASEREYEATLLQKQAEFSELQSQINPHFLYNTLETIRSEALLSDADEIANMTEALASFFRYSIGRKHSLVTLEDELENVETYFKIQRFRFEDRFSLKIEIDDTNEEILSYKLPRLTIQPIVENAIGHGLERLLKQGIVTISIHSTQKFLIISIRDNGVGMTDDELQRLRKSINNPVPSTRNTGHNGIALANVDQRIKLVFGEYYGLSISSTLDVGTTVEILLPRIVDSEKEENFSQELSDER